jgi:hypothetical protein
MNHHKKNIRLLFFTLLSHVCIFIVSIILLSIVLQIKNNDYKYAFVFILVLYLYFLSGYWLTQFFNRWYNYYLVAFIGIIIWLFAFFTSTNSLNYKADEQAYAWMIYRFYISGIESPLNFYDGLNFADKISIHFEECFIIIYPVIASIFQHLGGIFKVRTLKKV